jgi:hypothetical protein
MLGAFLSCPCIPAPGDHLHDGFFAAARAGVALFFAHEETTPDVPPFRSRVRGIGQSGEVMVGATPWPGLVLGGSLWTARIDPTFVEGGHVVRPDDDSVKVTVARIGPFLDWYPWPRRGFHTMASAAFGLQIESDVKGDPKRPAWVGVALAVGSGYEWFVGRESSIGFVARITLFDVARDAAGADDRVLSYAPELALAYTYH